MDNLRINKILIVLVTMFIFVPNAFSISFKASAPVSVVVGEPFRLAYTLDDRGGQNFKVDDVKNFDVVAGPYTSSSSSVQIINGQATSSASERYTYTLVARKTGTFTLPVATITHNGQRLTSNSVKVKVLPEGSNGNVTGNANTSSSKTPQTRSNAAGKGEAQLSGSNVFVRAIPSKTKLYEQDCLLITYKLYSLVDVIRSQGAKLPDFNGFMKQELPQDKNPQLKLEHYNDKNYMTVVLYQALLYPQHSGVITIKPFNFDFVFRLRQQSNANDFFSGFFDTYRDVEKNIASNSVTIHVDPLPSNKPNNFSGGVGSFSIQSSVTETQVSVNDPVTLKYVISGNGNLKMIKNPQVEFPADFETYDPKVNNNIKTTANGVSGSKTVEYLLIPRSAGDFKIPSYDFSYFDVKSKSYKSIRTPEFKIHVTPGSGQGNGVAMANYSNQEQLKMLGQDIRYVHTNEPYYENTRDYFLGSFKYWLVLVLSFILALVSFILLKKNSNINSDELLRKNRKANKVATKRLKTAKKFMEDGNESGFYEEIMRAMLGYAADKFSISQAELSKDNIRENLESNCVDNSDIEDFIDILSTCEFARYSPTSDSGMSNIYDKSIDVISRIQQNVKKK